jgi:hypothetical protein
MSGFLGYKDGELVIEKDDRLTFATGDRLVQFLTTEQTFTQNCVFPDVPKGELYIFEYDIDYTSLGSSYGYTFRNASCVGARPQEWDDQIVLGAVPDGADIFWGKISLTRTVSPTHSWGTESMTPRVVQGQYMQLTGSILLEQVRGLSRVLSVFIEDGNLIADLQQSCGPAAGNFGQWGVPIAMATTALGGQNLAPSGAGKYVATAHAGFTGTGTTTSYSGGFGTSIVDLATAYYNGGANEAPYSDPTNYGATYAITVKGRFGRRS